MEETSIPHDLRYTQEHEWIKVEGGVAIMGITDFAQKQLGALVFVEFPEVSVEVVHADELGVLESVKAASDYFSPLSGTIKEVNAAASDEPALINKDPYGDGWLVKIVPSDESEFQELLSASEYKAFLEEEE